MTWHPSRLGCADASNVVTICQVLSDRTAMYRLFPLQGSPAATANLKQEPQVS